MSEIDADVKRALYLLNGGYNDERYGKRSSVFLFGTENQQGVNQILHYDNKDVCTVASSGDQYLGAVYYGAKNVDVFDINRLSYYITYLKIIAIMYLEYEEFLDFFVPIDYIEVRPSFFNKITFKKLFPYMTDDVSYFWHHIVNSIDNNRFGNFIFPYQSMNHLDVVQRGMPFYSSEEEYNKLKEILINRQMPMFYQVDIKDLEQVLVNKYDVLYLSNIIECIVRKEIQDAGIKDFDSKKIDEIQRRVIDRLGSNIVSAIRGNGIVLMSYRPNSTLKYSNDLLYNFEYFNVGTVWSKVLPYDDDFLEQSDVDLVVTYKPEEKGLYFKK